MAENNDLPKKVYSGGEKKTLSLRLPEDLIKALNKIAKEKGWSFHEVVGWALDQYAQKNK